MKQKMDRPFPAVNSRNPENWTPKVRLKGWIMAALLAGDLENMFADVNEDVDYESTIIPPRVNAASFKIDGSICTIVKAEGQFRNSKDDDLIST
ncbi:hypothetical protein HAX54_001158 [Datura stramonium]|uniref:Uncharacterized protein n=1 Tax=Datura stramonium TaxID=4076 RepID=A0ABS8T338_DATST|nr:hypothetical protein [Datura stramonium]